MNAKKMITAVAALVLTGSAFAADNAEVVDFSGFQSVKTRAEVRAEVEQAYQQGTLVQSQFVEFGPVASSRSRDEVRKETMQTARNPSDNTYFGS